MKYLLKIFIGLVLLLVLCELVVLALFSVRQKEIADAISNTVRQYVNGEVEIGEVRGSLFGDFPNPAIVIQNVAIRDSLYPIHHKPFFKAQELVLGVRIRDILSRNVWVKSLQIHNGEFNVYTGPAGKSNDYLFKGRSLGGREKQFIDALKLREVIFRSSNVQKQNTFEVKIAALNSRFDDRKKGVALDGNCEMQTQRITLSGNTSNIFSNKHLQARFSMHYYPQEEVLRADSLALELDGNRLNIGIEVDMSGPAPVVNSKIHSGKLILF